jgi:hypothetical protein
MRRAAGGRSVLRQKRDAPPALLRAFPDFFIWHAFCISFARGPEGTLMTSARKWRGRHTAARRRRRFSPGPRRRWRLLPFGTASFAAVDEFLFPITFLWPFFRLALVRPALRRFSGRETVAAIRAKSPADLMAATASRGPRRRFSTPANRIFLPMILFGEGVRLHYLYRMISCLGRNRPRLKSCGRLERRAAP